MLPTNDPIVTYVAARHVHPQTGKAATPAQVLLKWAVQKVKQYIHLAIMRKDVPYTIVVADKVIVIN